MNVLVTGYSSRIGQDLIARLRQNNLSVYFAGRTPPIIEKANERWIPWTLGMKFDSSGLPKIDIVFHLAWNTQSRRESIHLNVGGSIQLIRHFLDEGSRTVFISSLAALNPLSNYGLAKYLVEKEFEPSELEIIRPGLIVNGPEQLNGFREKPVVPSPNQEVYLTHQRCLISQLTRTALENRHEIGDDVLVCESNKFSSLFAKKPFYIPIPRYVSDYVFKIPFKNQAFDDLKDRYVSMRTTPKIKSFTCSQKEDALYSDDYY
jgi:hypothetical protein